MSSNPIHGVAPGSRSRMGRWALPLLGLALALILTNSRFTFIDDEAAIIDSAAQPVRTTLALYWTGAGAHEHPPLYDVLLHSWLRATGAKMDLLRLPSIVFYVLGLWFLALATARIAGPPAGKIVPWMGALWPYGFHFGRLAAWYSLSFLLVAWLTHAYLRYLESPKSSRWLALFLASLALIYTSYFGWAVLCCFAVEFLWPSVGLARLPEETAARQRISRGLLTSGILLLAAYGPFWRAFLGEVGIRLGERPSFTASALYAGFAMYALFLSESIAPWFWWLAVPGGVAVAVCLGLVLFRGPKPARRFLFYFCLLFLAMIPLDILTTKRLMLIAPWLLLAVSATIASLSGRDLRVARGGLLASLAVIVALGWFGIVSRRYYSAPRFIEPWPEVTQQVGRSVREGAAVIGNNPSFFFYLTYALHIPDSGFAGLLPESVGYPMVYEPQQWLDAGRPVRPVTLLVKGVPVGGPEDELMQAEGWLDRNCNLQTSRKLLPDPGFGWKQRYFPSLGELPWRIEVRAYACTAPPH